MAEAQIRQRIESWTEALRVKDLDGLMSHYTENIGVFDIPRCGMTEPSHIARTGRIGSPRYRARLLVTRFATGASQLAMTWPSAAVSIGARTSGENTDVWVRATVCFRKVGGT